MNLRSKLIAILGFLVLLNQASTAQTPQHSMDLKLLENLEQNLKLNPDQAVIMEELVTRAADEIQALEKQKAQVQRESDDETFILTQLKVINQQVKDVREMRDLEIQSKLTVEQLAIYNEKIKPSKPQVLHFGLHNRADCNVCKQ